MNRNLVDSWSYAESNTPYFVNYTHAYELYGDELNLSPRNTFHSIYLYKDGVEIAHQEGKQLDFMDTDREKELNIGQDWPFDPLPRGGCIFNKDFAEGQIQVGDDIDIAVTFGEVLTTIIANYNKMAEQEGWELAAENIYGGGHLVHIDC